MFNSFFAKAALTIAVSMSSVVAIAQTGQEAFNENCSACHGEGGEGIEGFAPALKNLDLWTKLGTDRNNYIAGVMTGGLSGKYGMAMPPRGDVDTATLVSISHYILNDINGVEGGPDAVLIEQYKKTPLTHTQLRKMRDGQ